MEIEILSTDNLSPLMELVLELWEDCSFDEELETYQNIIGSETAICYLVQDQGIYIAFIHVSIRHDYVEGSTALPIAYVEAVFVKPNYQKRGIAKMLMNIAEEWAKTMGLRQIASDTDLSNTASIEFHKSVGFVEVERIVCFIKEL